jgi:alanine racemase
MFSSFDRCEVLALTDLRLCVAAIDTDAIRANARLLATAAQGLPFVADVASDGHGHGAVETALAALEGGASWLAVSSVKDAEPLRAAGIRVPILASFNLGGDDVAIGSLDVTIRDSANRLPRLFEPGTALYGIGAEAPERGLVAAMRVSAPVLITKSIQRGDGVSYGYTFRAERKTNLAMVAIGYADGLDRRAGNVASMSLAHKPRRIVGRVAMNAAVLDIGDDEVVLGETAVLFGPAGEPSAHSWADAVGATEDEVVTVFGRSLPRSYR